MAERRQPRIKRRVTCEIVVDGIRHRGIVRDVSTRGLFVQTQVRLAPNQVVDVQLPPVTGSDAFVVRARVARQKRVPPQLVRIAAGGIGLEVLDAPPQFQRFVDGARPGPVPQRPQAPSEAGASAPDDAGKPRFRVRVKQAAGSRSRTVVQEAGSASAAERAVLRELGPGWQVVETSPA